ncbi:MAG: arylesterase [Gammaproteobacteria bacterium]|nr:arylesterase [Gammaproteobacteria bacterium]MCP5198565.1 arylesterase [Gammaproteobacteria bacterium]
MLRVVLVAWGLLALAACSDDEPAWPPLAADAVILAYGDSLTHGTGAAADASYPAVLAAISGHRVVNAGVPGEVSAAGLARLGGVLERVRPALVILCHGGNDMLRKLNREAAAANLEAMIALARQHGARVLLLGVPAPGLLLSTAGFYHEVAAHTGAPLLDEALADILGQAALKADPVHPNAAGYRELADRIAARLRRLGALP